METLKTHDGVLHDIWPQRTYCGPAALAALTGYNAKEEIRSWINEIRGRPHNQGVLGMSVDEMIAVLEQQRYRHHLVKRPDKPRFHALAEHMQPDAFYIVNVTRHWVAFLNGEVADSITRFGCPISEHHTRRQMVKGFIIIP